MGRTNQRSRDSIHSSGFGGPISEHEDRHYREALSSSSSSESPYSLIADELPDDLIAFAKQQSSQGEPPRKRQKTDKDTQSASKESSASKQVETERAQDFNHIVVKQCTWGIKCVGSKLSSLDTPLEREVIRAKILFQSYTSPNSVEILDDTGRTLFTTPFPDINNLSEDVRLALEVNLESNKWAKGQGRLWTTFGLTLYHAEEWDYLQVNFTIKWNLTTSPYHIALANKKTKVLAQVLSAYFPDATVTASDKWSPQDFYQSVHVPSKDDESSASMVSSELKSDLYPFQKRAVQWLLRREGVNWSGVTGRVIDYDVPESNLPNSFIRVNDAHGQTCYVSHLFGIVTKDLTPFVDLERSLKGGVLAEEMGLGKTVEMISLILLHKRPETQNLVFDSYINESVRPTSATLIVTPPSILQQWISEINRHAPGLKVTHYEGIKSLRDNVDAGSK